MKNKCNFMTSSTPGEGKSTTSANLAITMAQNGSETILVDCDLRNLMYISYLSYLIQGDYLIY